jgi:hypothetical protein
MTQSNSFFSGDDSFQDQTIRVTVENITPEQAKDYLKTQQLNRNPNKLRISEYADRMQKNQWVISQPITFDSDGCLIDGQHRLLAIVKFGFPVTFSVMRGLPKSSASVFDIGQKRTVAQVARIQGVTTLRMTERVGILNAAILGSKLKLRTKKAESERNLSNLIFSDSNARSPQTMIALAEKYKDGLDFSLSRYGGTRTSNFVGNLSSVKAAVFRAYYNENRQRLSEFLEVFYTGFVKVSTEDSAAIALRNYLNAIKMGIKGVSLHDAGKSDAYTKTEAAILHFIARRDIRHLKGSDFEEFPLADFD